MAHRLELHDILVSLLGSDNVYFQPPPSLLMSYPAITYRRDDIFIQHADNKPYRTKTRYQVIVIDIDPDSIFHEQIAALPMCSYDRSYSADDLNHDVFNLYF